MLDMFTSMFRGYQPHEVIIEMAVIWVCVFFIFQFLRGTRGAGVIKGFLLMLVLLTVGVRMLGESFGRLRFLYDTMIAALAFLLVVVFQPELRQAMVRLGQARLFGRTNPRTIRIADAVAEAVGFLSKSQFGALIAIERNIGLGGLVEGGVMLDAALSARLLQSIFWPNNPLHDLGVVIRGDRVAAANVQFPLAEQGLVPSELGSRHRAGVGITFESDCLVVIVSEESGRISLAENGKLHIDIPRGDIREELLKALNAPPPTRDPDEASPLVVSGDAENAFDSSLSSVKSSS
jgi:diadenylate cyclase